MGVITDPENWQMLQQDPIQLVIVDERPIVRAGIVACLRGEADLDLLGDFDTLSRLEQDEIARADVVLLGYQYRTSVTDGVAELSRINDGIKVLVLSH